MSLAAIPVLTTALLTLGAVNADLLTPEAENASLLTLGAVNASLPEAYLIQTYAGKTSVVVKNVQISEDDSYDLAQAPSACACRARCFVDGRCIAHSYNASGACALSDKLGKTTQSSGATYQYSENFVKQADGLFYNKYEYASYIACAARCSHPGMRIPVVKTKASFDFIKARDTFVGLQKGGDGVYRWSDGSVLDQTIYGITSPPKQDEQTNIFVTYQGNFDDSPNLAYVFSCICQGAFINVN
ncbi:uncharacterized protein LOC108682563 [Hyalella azteca]|uniref:Uncharacterized protein LOC108682563 n=1 Tax=Hyalella azteca TaxID=294128 RepID=A0A8B7PP77_HYAAZ|nr:uncharacterized protein LOC108682563 [Hyalella azteca]